MNKNIPARRLTHNGSFINTLAHVGAHWDPTELGTRPTPGNMFLGPFFLSFPLLSFSEARNGIEVLRSRYRVEIISLYSRKKQASSFRRG